MTDLPKAALRSSLNLNPPPADLCQRQSGVAWRLLIVQRIDMWLAVHPFGSD